MAASDILEAALAQNPIEFKERFDEAAQAEIVRMGEAVKASILSGFSKLQEAKEDEKEKKETDKADEQEGQEEEEEEEELEEQKVEINTVDPRSTAKKLNTLGLKASTNPKEADGVVVQIKDKTEARKLKTWMLNNGFDQVDLEDAYPEILKAAK